MYHFFAARLSRLSAQQAQLTATRGPSNSYFAHGCAVHIHHQPSDQHQPRDKGLEQTAKLSHALAHKTRLHTHVNNGRHLAESILVEAQGQLFQLR